MSDLLAAKSMPCAVRTGLGWRGSGASSTIDSNELLVIKGVKRRLNNKFLKAYSPSTGKKKELPESCVGKCGPLNLSTMDKPKFSPFNSNPLNINFLIFQNSL